MANSDVLVRMKADTTGYDANIARARRQLDQFKKDNLSLGGILNQTTKSLLSAAAGFASLAAAASTISEVVSECNELAKAAEGIRLAFDRLNRPDLLDNLRQATHNTVTDVELMKQAVKFNDFRLSLDDMGAMLAFAQQKAKDTGESIDYMVNSITTGLGRQSKQILDNLGISAAEITERMKETGDMTTAVAAIIRDQMSKAGDYVETAADRAAQADVRLKNSMEELGRTLAPLTSAASTFWTDFKTGAIDALNDAVLPLISAMQYLGLVAENATDNLPTYKPSTAHHAQNTGTLGTYVETVDEDGNVIKAQHFDGEASKKQMAKYQRELEKMLTPKTTKTTKSLNIAFDPNKAILSATKGVDTMPSVWSMIMENGKTAGVGDQGLRAMMGIGKQQFDYGKVLDSYVSDPDKDKRDKKKEIDTMSELTKAINGVSSIKSGIEGMGIELPEEVDEAIRVIQSAMSIIQGVQAVISAFSTTVESANTAAIIANTVALTALTTAVTADTAVSAIPLLARGGIAHAANGFIGGNTFSGDQIPIMVNAGELILNKAQQGNLASQLQGGGMQNLQLEAVVRGEDLRFIINSNGRRTGRGEIVTTNFR